MSQPETHHHDIFIIQDFKWEVVIGGELGIKQKMTTTPPNRLQRFMYKFLLGWEVRILDPIDPV